MNCRTCGDVLPADAKFCIECKSPVASTGATQRLHDDGVDYVTRAEYNELLSSPFAVVAHPFLGEGEMLFYQGRCIKIREE